MNDKQLEAEQKKLNEKLEILYNVMLAELRKRRATLDEQLTFEKVWGALTDPMRYGGINGTKPYHWAAILEGIAKMLKGEYGKNDW